MAILVKIIWLATVITIGTIGTLWNVWNRLQRGPGSSRSNRSKRSSRFRSSDEMPFLDEGERDAAGAEKLVVEAA